LWAEGRLHHSRMEGETMLKTIIAVGTSLAFISAAGAADLPRPQPVPAAAPVIGKAPFGKLPVGKEPVVVQRRG